MTITISNLTVINNAPAGTVVGELTTWNATGNSIPCTYSLTKGSAGYFAISGNQLVTTWSTQPAAGFYSVRVRAVGSTATRFSGSAVFTIAVVTSAPPPPPPPPLPTIMVNGSVNAVVSAGSTLTVSVANGPGTIYDWVGISVAGSADTSYVAWEYLSGTETPPSIGLTAATITMTAPASPGSYEARFYYNNGYTVLASTSFTVQSAAPPPPPPAPVITVTPSNPTIPDTTPLGAVVASFAVTMSDGSPFTGSVGFGAPYYDAGGIFAISGNNIVVNPSGPGVGPNSTTLTDQITLEATQ